MSQHRQLLKVIHRNGNQHEGDSDIAKLKEEIASLREISDDDVGDLYEAFSAGSACAGWLILSEDTISNFRKWILTGHALDYADGYKTGYRHPDWP